MDPFIGKGLDKIIEGASDGPIKTLNSTWELFFGSYHNYVEKVQFKRDINLQQYKDDIQKELETIPPENLQEPKISILGPALESSKFYIEEEEIRMMFSKLISSAMDNRKNIYTHHSFVEIIKQLSPSDAIFLKSLSESEVLPAVEYKAVTNSDGSHIKLSNALVSNSPLDIYQTELSISNLSRVGIVKVSIGVDHLSTESLYHPFYSSPLIEHFCGETDKLKYSHRGDVYEKVRFFTVDKVAKDNDLSKQEVLNLLTPYGVDITKGEIRLSPIGKAFIETCIR